MKDVGDFKTTTLINPTLKDQKLTLDIKTDGIIKHHFQEIVDFKEKTVKEALIKFGWTPPVEVKPHNEVFRKQWYRKDIVNNIMKEKISRIKELEQQIENMKCCGNCCSVKKCSCNSGRWVCVNWKLKEKS